MITVLAVAAVLLPAAHALAATERHDHTVAAGVVDASPLGSGGDLPQWLPRTEGELVPLGVGILLLFGSYAALRRSTGVARLDRRP